MVGDRLFIEELVARCQEAGIPVRAQPEEISSLLYPLVLTILQADDFGPYQFDHSIDLFLDLVAAFCLGEVESRVAQPGGLNPQPEKGSLV